MLAPEMYSLAPAKTFMLKMTRDCHFLFAIMNNMNDGISVEEACKQTPSGLTAEQLKNCPGQEAGVFIYVLIAIAVVALVLLGSVVYRAIKSKKS